MKSVTTAAPAWDTAALTAPPVLALRERLDELAQLLRAMPGEIYCARTSRVSGSIGEHVRHILDHVSALVEARRFGTFSYDHRSRGTAVECEPAAAVREADRLDAALERWGTQPLDEPVAVTALVSEDGPSVTGWSTLARELAFVMSHTIHHQASIALLLERAGCEPASGRFGYAPSTPRRS